MEKLKSPWGVWNICRNQKKDQRGDGCDERRDKYGEDIIKDTEGKEVVNGHHEVGEARAVTSLYRHGRC